MTDDHSPGPDERLLVLRRDLTGVSDHLRDLRIQILRLYAGACALLIAIGLVLPAWTERSDDDDVTSRVAGVGWQVMTTITDPRADDPPTDSDLILGWAFGIGFTGLTVTAILLLATLLFTVMGLSGRRRAAWYRRAVGVLTILGGALATILSLIATTSESGTGGWGPAVLTAGAVAAVALIEHAGWHDLWVIDRPH